MKSREITYQAVAYLEIGRVFPFLKAVNEVLESKGMSLPLIGYPRSLNALTFVNKAAEQNT